MEFLKLTFVNGMNMAASSSKYCDNVESYLNGIEIEKDDENIGYIYEHFNKVPPVGKAWENSSYSFSKMELKVESL